MTLAFLPLSSCASVIMCSHIGVPERSTEGGRGEGDERNIGNGAEYEGGSPVNLEMDHTPCTYELDLQMYVCVCAKHAYMPTAVIRENK